MIQHFLPCSFSSGRGFWVSIVCLHLLPRADWNFTEYIFRIVNCNNIWGRWLDTPIRVTNVRRIAAVAVNTANGASVPWALKVAGYSPSHCVVQGLYRKVKPTQAPMKYLSSTAKKSLIKLMEWQKMTFSVSIWNLMKRLSHFLQFWNWWSPL